MGLSLRPCLGATTGTPVGPLIGIRVMVATAGSPFGLTCRRYETPGTTNGDRSVPARVARTARLTSTANAYQGWKNTAVAKSPKPPPARASGC